MRRRKKSVPIEAVGCRIEFIGGSIHPKETSWGPTCPHCGKTIHVRLVWDQDACEWSLIMEDYLHTQLMKEEG